MRFPISTFLRDGGGRSIPGCGQGTLDERFDQVVTKRGAAAQVVDRAGIFASCLACLFEQVRRSLADQLAFASAVRHRITVGATEPRASRASRISPELTWRRQATLTTEIAWLWRSPNLMNAYPTPAAWRVETDFGNQLSGI